MDSPTNSEDSTTATSRHLAGPPDLRYYANYHLVAWQPHGTLDDRLLDEIAVWLVEIEKVSEPFKRFVDFSQLTTISLQIRHVFDFARDRAKQFAGIGPVRTALFSQYWVGFGIASLYAALMENTPIEARAFFNLSEAAEWLGVPAEVLTLKDTPRPHVGITPPKTS
jgi:hypothetical protein